jgi:hypothetical protein
MSAAGRCLSVLLAVALVNPTAAQAGQRLREAVLGPEYLAEVQLAARQLIFALAQLQEDVVMDLGGQKERTLYRQADDLLGRVTQFAGTVKPGASRKQLYKGFNEIDLKLSALLHAVRAVGKEQRPLQRDAVRLLAAGEQLHYALSAGDPSEERTREVIRRQAEALIGSARDLEQTIHYALADSPDRGNLEDNLHRLIEAGEQFRKGLGKKADRRQLRELFARVSHEWQAVGMGLRRLTPRENNYLLRSANRVDRYFERLFHLLGVKGKRPQLTIRT